MNENRDSIDVFYFSSALNHKMRQMRHCGGTSAEPGLILVKCTLLLLVLKVGNVLKRHGLWGQTAKLEMSASPLARVIGVARFPDVVFFTH